MRDDISPPEVVPLPGPPLSIHTCPMGKAQALLEAGQRCSETLTPLSSDEKCKTQLQLDRQPPCTLPCRLFMSFPINRKELRYISWQEPH